MSKTVAALVRQKVLEVLNGLPVTEKDGLKLKAISIVYNAKGKLCRDLNVFSVGNEAKIAADACKKLWNGGSMKLGDTEWFLNIEEAYDPVTKKPVFAENGNDTLREVYWATKVGDGPIAQSRLGQFYKRYGTE